MRQVTLSRAPVLAHCRGRVSGNTVAAVLLRWHLQALGAEVVAGGPCPRGQAAAAELSTPAGQRRSVVVEWGGPVPGVVDETTAQALCGPMHVHGRRDGRPRGLGVDYCTTAAAVLGLTGALASLLDGRPAGEIRTSVAEAALLSVSQYVAAAGADDAGAVSLEPGGGPFTSADGVAFEIESLRPEQWAAFWSRLGVERAAVARSWQPFQFRYATATAPMDPSLYRIAARTPFAALRAAAGESGVDIETVRAGSAADFSYGGPWPLPWSLSCRQDSARTVPHGSVEAPMRGISVLEAGRRVQAPLAAHVLDLLGASTTRIEPPGGDPMRGMPPTCGSLSARWLALNRGKSAVELDIKSAGDRADLILLAESADVFLHNWAPGRAESLGLGADDLPEHLVYAHMSALGGHDVPDPPVGTDFMVQARSGLGEQVRAEDEAAGPSLMTLLDVLGGLLGAESTVAGLLCRSRGGAEVDSGLFGAAAALRVPSNGRTRCPPKFRQPEHTPQGWIARPEGGGAAVPVSDDLSALFVDPRFDSVISRDDHSCPMVRAPWRFS